MQPREAMQPFPPAGPLPDLGNVVEDADCPIVGMDFDGTIRSWNLGAQSMLGFTKAEAVGQHINLITPPDQHAENEEALRALAKNGMPSTYETKRVGKDGVSHWTLTTLSPLRDSEGTIVGASSISQDISSLKRAAEECEAERRELSKRVAELKTICDAVPIGIVQAHDREGSIVTGNPAANALLGTPSGTNISSTALSAGDLPYRLFRDGKEVPPDQRLLQRCASQGIPYYDVKQELRFTDGRIKHVLSSGVPLFDEQGTPRGAVAFMKDVTEQHTREETLEQALEDLNTVLDEVPVGVILARDPQGKVVRGNAATRALYNMPAGANISVIGPNAPTLPFHCYKDEKELSVKELPLERSLAGERTHDFEMELRFEDGSIKHVVVQSVPLYDRNGAIRGAVATSRDVTALHRQEEELRHAIAEQQKKEIALEEAVEDLNTILQEVPVGVLLTRDPQGSVVIGNEATAALYNVPAGTNISRIGPNAAALPHRYYKDGKEIPIEGMPLVRSLAGERTHDFEMELRFRDGAIKHVVSSSVPLYDWQGKIRGAVATTRDVTELHRQARELERVAAELRTILDILPVGVVVSHDPASTNITGNRMFDATFQIPGDPGLVGGNVSVPLPLGFFQNGKELSVDDLPLQRAAREGARAVEQEIEVRFENGKALQIVVNAVPLLDKNGASKGAVASVLDVTEIRAKERELERTVTQLRTILDIIPTGIAVLDGPEGKFVIRNRAVLNMVGLPAGLKPLVRQPAEPLAFETYRDGRRLAPEELPAQRAARTGEPVGPQELEFRKPDGTTTYVLNSAVPLVDKEGNVIGSVSSSTDISTLRAKERELERTVTQLRTILDIIPTGIAVLEDTEGHVITRNKALVEMLGLPEGVTPSVRQTVEPLPFEPYQDGRKLSPGELPAQRAVRTGVPVPAQEIEFRLRDGTIKQVLNSASPFFDKEGKVAGSVSSITDVTMLRAKERELEQAVAKLTTILDLIPTGIAILEGKKGRFVTRNRALVEMLGLPAGIAPLVQHSIDPLPFEAYQDGRKLTPQELPAQRAMRTGAPVPPEEMEYRLLDGTVKQVLNGAFPIFDKEGKVMGSVSSITDVTVLRAKERELERTVTQLRTILDIIPTGVVIFHDTQSTLVTRNRALMELLGMPTDGLALTTHIVDRLPFDAYKDGKKLTKDDLPGGRAMAEGVAVLDEEFEMRLQKGMVRQVLSSAVPLSDGDGIISGAVATMTDVTMLRSKERELAEALRQKDAFLRMLGHELRNPMAVISASISNIEFMMEEAGLDPAISSLSVVQREVDHLKRLLDDMLDIARIARGGLEIKREPVFLEAIAQEAVEENEVARATHGARTVLKVEDDDLWVNGDSQRLAQVLRNILTNSRKFTPVGGTITVTVTHCPEHDGRVGIIIQDTGTGIDPAELPYMFDAFWQSPSSGNRSGLGLGLAICKEIVERHGGTILAESEGLGTGLRTTVCLPLAEHALIPTPTPPVGKPTTATIANHRVLLIEDDHLVSGAMEILLGFLGQTVEVAYTGSEGIAKARQFKPDIVLCDIGLPGDMDGYAVARALASDPTVRKTRLIALSGYVGPEEQARSEAAGFDMHLAKPIGVHQLRKILAETPV